ncbi:hypothetical protein ACFV16_40240 [Streptomyces massasporeus]|uniref:hypothetical protein n=1 Tax=Streptomyces massasporeus TaxID=67324 RepID=UPI0036B3B77E
MRTLTARSATLAACAVLLLTGTAVQASADDAYGHSGTHRSGTDTYKTDITVRGDNNNTAGNDLIIGDNNTSGAGHTITNPPLGTGVGDQLTFAVANHTSRILTIQSAADCQNCTVPGPFPFNMPPNVNSVVFPVAPLEPGDNAQLNLHYTASDGTDQTVQVLMNRASFGAPNIYCNPNPQGPIFCNQITNTTLELVDVQGSRTPALRRSRQL